MRLVLGAAHNTPPGHEVVIPPTHPRPPVRPPAGICRNPIQMGGGSCRFPARTGSAQRAEGNLSDPQERCAYTARIATLRSGRAPTTRSGGGGSWQPQSPVRPNGGGASGSRRRRRWWCAVRCREGRLRLRRTLMWGWLRGALPKKSSNEDLSTAKSPLLHRPRSACVVPLRRSQSLARVPVCTAAVPSCLTRVPEAAAGAPRCACSYVLYAP